jgi:Dolichyl-phosphate-mannose-protein mannosyltransferase
MMNKSYTAILLFSVSLLAGVLFMNEGLFYHDSVVLAQAVESTQATGILHPAIRGRYGSVIVDYLISLPALITGHNADWAVRFSSVLFHALSIAALFLFLSLLFTNAYVAFFAALLFSFTPLYFSPNTYGKEHGMSIFFLLSALLVLYRGLKKQSLVLIVLSALVFVFSITVRESMLGAIPLFFLLFFYPGLEIKNKLRLLLPALLAMFLGLSLIMNLYLSKEIYNALFVHNSASTIFLGLFSIQSYSFLFAGISPHILVLLWIFFVIGAFKMYKDKHRFLAAFFFVWLIIFLYQANTNGGYPRYLDMCVIAGYVFVAYALADLAVNNKIIAHSIFIYFVLSMLIFMAPMLNFRHTYNGPKQFALYINKNTENNAIIIAMDDAPFIEYYGKRATLKHPIDDPEKTDVFLKSIAARLQSGGAVYLVSDGLKYDYRGIFQKAFFEDFKLTLVGRKLTENYHRTEHGFAFYSGRLYRVSLKK